MRVLEIKGFMHFPRDYEGDHDLIRWRMGSGRDHSGGGLGVVLRERKEILALLREQPVDVILCQIFGIGYGLRKGGALRPLRHWLKARYESILIREVIRIKRLSGAPLGVVDISDDPTIHPINLPLLEEADCYLKRELPLDPYHAFESLRKRTNRAGALMDRKQPRWERWVRKLEPISLGCAAFEPSEGGFPPGGEKKWDVFYAGDDAYKPRRQGVVSAVRELESLGFRVRMPEKPLPCEEFLRELSMARLAISPPGLGWDCHRHYEAAMVGTVPVTPYPTIRRHAPLLDGEHSLFFDPEKELAPQFATMLSDPKRLEKIGESAQVRAREHHTFRKIFQYAIDETVAKSGGDSQEVP